MSLRNNKLDSRLTILLQGFGQSIGRLNEVLVAEFVGIFVVLRLGLSLGFSPALSATLRVVLHVVLSLSWDLWTDFKKFIRNTQEIKNFLLCVEIFQQVDGLVISKILNFITFMFSKVLTYWVLYRGRQMF